jgi:hypothetical protein
MIGHDVVSVPDFLEPGGMGTASRKIRKNTYLQPDVTWKVWKPAS